MTFDDFIAEGIRAGSTVEELAESLEHLLGGGFGVWTDGQLYEIRQLVDRVKGLRIEIFPNEHPPPHFHVRYGSVNASFAIADGRLLHGEIGGRDEQLVRWWHKHSRAQLIKVWNATRPSDCPVGPIVG